MGWKGSRIWVNCAYNTIGNVASAVLSSETDANVISSISHHR